MSLQFVFGGSGRGKTYYVQSTMLKESEANPEKEYMIWERL